MANPSEQTNSFTVLIWVVSLAMIWLVLPYYGAVLWAVILAILFLPMQTRLTALFGGRRSLAAVATVLACICIVVIPGTLLLSAMARQASELYASLGRREFDPAGMLEQVRAALPYRVQDVLAQLNLAEFSDIQAKVTGFLESTMQVVAKRVFFIGQGTAQFFIGVGVMLYLLFFLFRDGPRIAGTIRRASPLSDPHTDRLLTAFVSVVKATVKGNLIIALVQGAIGGMAFWLLGIRAALLWGVVMTVLSLIPAVGAGLVWAPVAVYLLIAGDWFQGIVLMLVGVFVISLIDNLLRPSLVGKDTRLPDYVILISTLGGLAVLGINGFVLGPLVAALFFAVWSLRIQDRENGN
ncbi:AI-2E family transporter [Paenirhodobacter sp.]|uniref:AI-2E family transporter n=1 Tax=Paenirhodobacter sp. TaxID=1965326 RepID=UPI003B4093DF